VLGGEGDTAARGAVGAPCSLAGTRSVGLKKTVALGRL